MKLGPCTVSSSSPPNICQDIFQLKRRNVEKKLTPRPILGKIGSVAHNVEHFPLKPESSYPPFMPKRNLSATIVQSVLKDHVMTYTRQNQCRFQIDKKLFSFELNIKKNHHQQQQQQQQHWQSYLGGVVTSMLSFFDKFEMFFGKMLLMLKNSETLVNIADFKDIIENI